MAKFKDIALDTVKHVIRYLYYFRSLRNKFSIKNKRILYNDDIETNIWSYATPFWECAAKSNIEIYFSNYETPSSAR